MREEIIEIENKTIEKIHEIKSWFFEKTSKIDKLLDETLLISRMGVVISLKIVQIL